MKIYLFVLLFSVSGKCRLERFNEMSFDIGNMRDLVDSKGNVGPITDKSINEKLQLNL